MPKIKPTPEPIDPIEPDKCVVCDGKGKIKGKYPCPACSK